MKNTQNRLCLTKMNFHRKNYNTYEAQNFSELASYAYERPVNFSEFI